MSPGMWASFLRWPWRKVLLRILYYRPSQKKLITRADDTTAVSLAGTLSRAPYCGMLFGISLEIKHCASAKLTIICHIPWDCGRLYVGLTLSEQSSSLPLDTCTLLTLVQYNKSRRKNRWWNVMEEKLSSTMDAVHTFAGLVTAGSHFVIQIVLQLPNIHCAFKYAEHFTGLWGDQATHTPSTLTTKNNLSYPSGRWHHSRGMRPIKTYAEPESSATPLLQ